MGVEEPQIVVNPTISEKRTVADWNNFGGTLLPIFNSFATYLKNMTFESPLMIESLFQYLFNTRNPHGGRSCDSSLSALMLASSSIPVLSATSFSKLLAYCSISRII